MGSAGLHLLAAVRGSRLLVDLSVKDPREMRRCLGSLAIGSRFYHLGSPFVVLTAEISYAE